MNKKFETGLLEIQAHRAEIIDKLVQFSLTDMLLFWGQEKDLIDRQQQVWGPILVWAHKALETDFVTTHGLDVPSQNKESGVKIRMFIEKLSDKELFAFYMAALNMRSVLLAAALVKKQLNAEEAFEAAYIEELWQAENWGVEEEAEKKRDALKKELIEIENFLKE